MQIIGTNKTFLKALIGNKTENDPTLSIFVYFYNHLHVLTRFDANYCIILRNILSHSHSYYPVSYAHASIFFTDIHIWYAFLLHFFPFCNLLL